MMKNKNQIISFIKTVRAEDEINKMAILGYCQNMLGIKVSFSEENKDFPVISLEGFKSWIEKAAFQRGDVVVNKENGGIGIVDSVEYRNLSLVAFVDKAGVLHEGKQSVALADCRKAAQDEMTGLQRLLNRKGLGWNRRQNSLYKQDYVPKENHQVRLSIMGRKMGLGVFKEIDADGRLVMYCVKMTGEAPRYSLHEIIGPAEDYQLNQISTYERDILTEELKKSGISWNGHLKRLESVCIRADKGNAYHYLNDLFEIVTKPDDYQSRDTKRWRAGNYFTQLEEIEAVREKLVSRKTRMQS